MASLKSVAQYVREDVQDGIAYISLWKEGRGWAAETYYLEERKDNTVELDHPEDLESMKKILSIDPRAIIVNGYRHNLGVWDECVSLENLVASIRWQYDGQYSPLSDFIKRIV